MVTGDRLIKSQDWLRWFNKFGSILALLFVYGFFVILNAKMTSLTAIETIVQQTVIVGVSAIGMTLVIIAGGIDLSAGSVIAMSSVIGAWSMVSLGLGPILAAFCGIIAGLFWGLVNGILITHLRLAPFIVTLGMLLVVRGFAKGMARSMPINVQESWLNDILAVLPPDQKWQLIPPGGWLMILLALSIARITTFYTTWPTYFCSRVK